MGNRSSNSKEEALPNPRHPVTQESFVSVDETEDKPQSYWEMMKVVH